MKETFTYKEILEAVQASNHLTMMPAPPKTAYRLAKLVNKLRSLSKDIDKNRFELYKIWGHEKTPGKGDYAVPEDKMPDFLKELDTFLGGSIEIEFHPIVCNQFEKLPAEAIIGMGKFMVEQELIDTSSPIKNLIH